jgi:protein-tyrosine-phosphatase
MKKKILFVCNTNVFRSPVAEKLFKRNFGKKFIVHSAGVSKKYLGKKIRDIVPENVLKRMKKSPINVCGHKVGTINKSKMLYADLILVMDNKNKNRLVGKFPQFSNKIFLLKEFAGYKRNLDILDAAGASLSFHDKVYKQIKKAIERIEKRRLL